MDESWSVVIERVLGGGTGLVVNITAVLGAIVYNWSSSLVCDPCYNHSLPQIIPLSEVHLLEKQINPQTH
jgi:hypothetical protein